MGLRQVVAALRRRWLVFVPCCLVFVLGALLWTMLSPRTYEASAQLFVSTAPSPSDGAGSLAQGGQFIQQRVKSYAELLSSPLVTVPVIEQLDLQTSPSELGQKITATAPLDTVLIDMMVRDSTPERAKAIADAVALQFVDVISVLETPAGSLQSVVKVTVVRGAEVPAGPASPRPLVNLALGAAIGLLVGCVSALLRDNYGSRPASVPGAEPH